MAALLCVYLLECCAPGRLQATGPAGAQAQQLGSGEVRFASFLSGLHTASVGHVSSLAKCAECVSLGEEAHLIGRQQMPCVLVYAILSFSDQRQA